MAARLRLAPLAFALISTFTACSPRLPVGSYRAAIWGGHDDDDTPEANVVVDLVGCTGTLITPSIVLTANHCITGTCDSNGCRNGVGTHPNIIIGALGSEITTARTYSTNNAQPITVLNQRWNTDDPGIDLALVFLDPPRPGQLPTEQLAKVVRPSLISPTWPGDVNGGLYAQTWGISGWSPRDQNGNFVFQNRQAAMRSPQELEHEPGTYEGILGQVWIMDAETMGVGLGDSGGPLFVLRNDAGCALRGDCNTRDVMGVASLITDTVGDTDNYWVDVTRGFPHDFITSHVEDHSHDAQPKWLAMHPRMMPGTITDTNGNLVVKWQPAAGPRWIGEVDYTGPCTRQFDQDCDHWYDEHDNCAWSPNPDQIDSDDDGFGDFCPPLITSISPMRGVKEGGTQVNITGQGFRPGTQIYFDQVHAAAMCSLTNCTTWSPRNGGGVGIQLQGTVMVSARLDGVSSALGPATQFTYEDPPPPPSCTSSLACPSTYGPQIMSVYCDQLVDFYLYDSYTGAISKFPGYPDVSMSRPTDTYAYDAIVACPYGLDPAWRAQSCASLSTYESTLSWCGRVGNTGNCSKGTHWCGDDEGCQKSCN